MHAHQQALSYPNCYQWYRCRYRDLGEGNAASYFTMAATAVSYFTMPPFIENA